MKTIKFASILLILLLLHEKRLKVIATKDEKEKEVPLPKIMGAMANSISEASKEAESKRKEELDSVSQGLNLLPNSNELLAEMDKFDLKPGQKEDISVESDPGYNQLGNYQPASFTISETYEGGSSNIATETKGAQAKTFSYPAGQGPLMMNGCYGSGYKPTDPCAKARIPAEACPKMLDSAAFIGVGFDGRGFYSSQSRKMSLIQRKCNEKNNFMNGQLPDNMNAFGIYSVDAETKSFSSLSNYAEYLIEKAQVSSQKGMFQQEMNQYSTTKGNSVNMAPVGMMVGGGVGLVATGGNPVGLMVGATIGGLIASTIDVSKSEGNGKSKSETAQKGEGSSKSTSFNQQTQGSESSFFAMMFINIEVYEITLNEITPDMLTEGFLEDFLNLPSNYYVIGASEKYQDFLLKYGTHFVQSAEFGGQLKIVKTMKTEKKMTMEEFSQVADEEFKALTNTLQSEVSQKASSYSFLGTGSKSQERKEKQKSKIEQTSNSKTSKESKKSQKNKESEFTETTVVSEGGNPAIASALFDFYSPEFKSLFGDWVESIPDYIKPFVFQLREIDNLLNINMDALFPTGNKDFGCVNQDPEYIKNLKKDEKTGLYYYVRLEEIPIGNYSQLIEKKVFCRYKSFDDFKEKFTIKLRSLQQAIAIYMMEGPAPTSSFVLKGGKPGCETDTLAYIGNGNKTKYPSYFKLKSEKFKVQFQLPHDIGSLIKKDQTVDILFRGKKWYTLYPDSYKFDSLSGCELPEVGSLNHPVCINGVLFSYDLAGFLVMTKSDFEVNSKVVPDLDSGFANYPAARVLEISFFNSTMTKEGQRSGAIPCNVYWSNTHTIDRSKNLSCIDFMAATEGDIFIIFATVPKTHSTWYYVQINSEGVGFYKGFKQVTARIGLSIGSLGDPSLFESFFVCIHHLPNNDLILMYGKSQPNSENNRVFATAEFDTGGIREPLRFYSFGSGEKSVDFLNIQVIQGHRKLQCEKPWTLIDFMCRLDCHDQCKKRGECINPYDASACRDCKNLKIINKGKTTCVKMCPKGYEILSEDVTLCTKCPVGTFKSKVGNHSCVKCPLGYFSQSAGSIQCQACPKGKFINFTGSDFCFSCAKGHYTQKLGSKYCKSCKPGQFSNNVGSESCQKCDIGHFSNNFGSFSCIQCESGTVSSTYGLKQCSPCPRGYEQPDRGQHICHPCEPGHYSTEFGTAICKLCPMGTHQDRPAMSECKRCPAGSHSTLLGAVTCDGTCPAGSYSDSPDSECKLCPAGTYQKGVGALGCRSCMIGFFQPLQGRSSCVKAPPGSYVDQVAAEEMKDCPRGTANKYQGSNSSSYCKECLAGSYSPKSRSPNCLPCLPGEYQSKNKQHYCEKCPESYFSNKMRSIMCRKCPTGSISNIVGSDFCHICEKGTVAVNGKECQECGQGRSAWKKNNNDVGATICVDCPVGTYTSSTSHYGPCTPCPKGSYSNKPASSKCILCKPGYKLINSKVGCEKCKIGEYQSLPGSVRCLRCLPGSYSSSGAKICSSCPAGQYQKYKGQSNCTLCPVGFYSSKKNSVNCLPCEAGTFSKVKGSSTCTSCPKGYHLSKKKQSTCLICKAGTYSKAGAKKCIACGVGEFQNRTGQSSCLPCQPGYYARGEKNIHCKVCPKNTYQSKSKQDKCLPCSKISRSQPGSTVCNGCFPGYEIGRVIFTGKARSGYGGSNSECVFTNKNCRNYSTGLPNNDLNRVGEDTEILTRRKKFWNSGLYNNFPKWLEWKFDTPKTIIAFQMKFVDDYEPIDKVGYSLSGTNLKNNKCDPKNQEVLVIVSESGEKLIKLTNNKAFYCYTIWIYKRNEKKKLPAAIWYPIKFYEKVTPENSKCTLCPVGEYQPQDGGFACLTCEKGKYTDVKGSTSCKKVCPKGKMSNYIFGASRCVNCPAGSYNDEIGQTTCFACLPGTRSLNDGATKCTKCPEGWFMSRQGQKHCACCAFGCRSLHNATRCIAPIKPTNMKVCEKKFIDVVGGESFGNQQDNFFMSARYMESKDRSWGQYFKESEVKTYVDVMDDWNHGVNWRYFTFPNLFKPKPK